MFTVEEVEELYDLITQLHEGAYKELYDIFKLPGDDSLWDRYVMHSIEGLPEQKMFAIAADKVRCAWLKLPRKKAKREKEIDDEHDPIKKDSNGVRI